MPCIGRLALVMVLLRLSLAQAATYHVAPQGNDAASCAQAQSASTPRRTINGALRCVSGGDTVLVGPGTYNEQIADSAAAANPGYAIVPVPSGSAQAFTTIKAAPLHGATLRASINGGSNPYIVNLSGSATRYVRLEGFVIDGEKGASGMHECLTTWESRDIHFVDLHCKNATLGWSGAGENITFLRVWMTHIGGGAAGGAAPCTAGGQSGGYPGLCHGLYAQAGSSRHGPIIVDNSRFEDINGYGVHNYVPTIVRNSCFTKNWQGGIYSSTTLTAENNVITQSGTHGILAGYGTSILRGNTVSQVLGVQDPGAGHVIGGGILTNPASTVQDNGIAAVASGGVYLSGTSTNPAQVSGNQCTGPSQGCTMVASVPVPACGSQPQPEPPPVERLPAPTDLRAIARP